jgi:Transposase
LGKVAFARRYVTGPDGGHYPADLALGLDGSLSRQATRMATLLGVTHPFDRAAALLAQLCGWTVDAETIRRTTHATARRAADERPARADATPFATDPGAIEVLIDAGKVNTRGGWRDVKMALFVRRPQGSPATVAEWATRRLPPPTRRTVVVAVEECGAFAGRVRQELDRLRITTAPNATVLGDGAEWIWNLADEVLPQATGVLDVFHAVEHLCDAVTAVFGTDTARIAAHVEAGRQALLAAGKPGVDHWLVAVMGAVPPGVSAEPLVGLSAYLAKHPMRLSYAERLAAGRSIGSGAVEGAIKQWVNLRMKRSGAGGGSNTSDRSWSYWL